MYLLPFFYKVEECRYGKVLKVLLEFFVIKHKLNTKLIYDYKVRTKRNGMSKVKGGLDVSIEVFNRREKKYLIEEEMLGILREEIAPYMEADSHNPDNKTYTISNIYYDTPNNDIITRSIQKPIYKEKLRLRGYGVPSLNDKVFIEIKKKYDGVVNKRRSKILLQDAYEFIKKGRMDILEPYMNEQIIREIEYFLSVNEIIPALYLAYDRYAYFDKTDSDFRLTFDTNIRTRRYDLGLEFGSQGERLLEEGKWIMEIKASNAVPLWFARLLSKYQLYPVSFSKYGTEFLNSLDI